MGGWLTPPPKTGHELGVRYMLESSVRKAGKSARITAELVAVETGSHLWANPGISPGLARGHFQAIRGGRIVFESALAARLNMA